MKSGRILFLVSVLVLFSFLPASAQYDRSYVGEAIEYNAKYEDTFVHLARRYGLGFVEMRAANPDIDPWIPGRGTDLILPTRHVLPDAPRDGIVINLPEMRLYAFVNKDRAPDTYAIGIGREGLDTPLGRTKVVRKQAAPTWRPTARMRKEDPSLPVSVPPGPENPLGTHAIYLGWPTYAIHGTNRAFGIGRRISSGCIRLYPEKIDDLFRDVKVGTPVTVVDQPIKAGWIDDKLYIEAHPSISQAIQMEETGVLEPTKLNEQELNYILKVAGPHKDRLRWPAIRMAVKARRGYPVPVARRPYRSGVSVVSSDHDLDDIYRQDNDVATPYLIPKPKPDVSMQARTYND